MIELEQTLSDLGYYRYPKMLSVWRYPREYQYKGQPGRFMLNLRCMKYQYRFQWAVILKSEIVYLMMRVIMKDRVKYLKELERVIEAVADPGKAPLLFGIDWAAEIIEILLGGASDD